ncbi:ATP-dependent DNA helicase RecQ [Salmonella enterica subsp. enterica]|nr:ATP-dependent DNA helicase RecQ [Salmonella enterica subsp. enterica]
MRWALLLKRKPAAAWYCLITLAKADKNRAATAISVSDPPKQYDGLNDAQIALSTIGRVNQRFGMGYVVEVIRGANNQRIRDFGP